MCDGVVPTDSSWSTSGHQESVGVHVDAHSQHVVFDVVSWCGPFRHPLPRHREGPIISTHGPKPRPLRLFFVTLAREGLTQSKNVPGQLTFDPTDRGCKPLQDKRA